MAGTGEENKAVDFMVEGMDCADCALHIERDISKIPGIHSVTVNFMTSRMSVKTTDISRVSPEIFQAVRAAGYSIRSLDGSKTGIFRIQGLNSRKEARKIRVFLSRQDGIQKIRIKYSDKQVILEHKLEYPEILRLFRTIGFEAQYLRDPQRNLADPVRKNRMMLLWVTVSGLAALTGIGMQYWGVPDLWVIPVYLIAILSGGFHIAQKGWKEARNLRLGMNFLMSLAVIGAMIIGEWSEAAAVIFLFSLAELLESFSIQRARKSLASLVELTPAMALIKTPDGLVEKAVEEVQIGEIVVIRPGYRIPLDGQVSDGFSTVDQSPITGESVPLSKSPGEDVYAGCLNQQGVLEIRVSKTYKESTLAKIIHLVEDAQVKRAPIQNYVDKFARYYTPVVVALAVCFACFPPLIFGTPFSVWFYRALVLLVISCPCALVISTPITIVSALTNASRNGILIKGGAYLENFYKIRVIAFDKTGTLTYGRPVVQQIIPLNGYDENEILQIAASMESNSEHAIAQAILDCALEKGIELKPVTHFRAITGRGAVAKLDGQEMYIGNHKLFEENGWCQEDIHRHIENLERKQLTTVLVGNHHKMLGLIALADDVRKEARESVQKLRDLGVSQMIMLTGDNEITAGAISEKTGMDKFHAELLPDQKVKLLRDLQKFHPQVAMIGDGVNDAPALAAATIGISMGTSASDLAIETADITLMQDDLNKIPYLKKLSHKTISIIKQNIFLSLLLKAAFFGLAIPGIATLWMAVFADMGASLLVIFNGLRALRVK